MMLEVSQGVTELQTPRIAHWIAEENPVDLAANLIGFLRTGP
jgi:hypothetical protein